MVPTRPSNRYRLKKSISLDSAIIVSESGSDSQTKTTMVKRTLKSVKVEGEKETKSNPPSKRPHVKTRGGSVGRGKPRTRSDSSSKLQLTLGSDEEYFTDTEDMPMQGEREQKMSSYSVEQPHTQGAIVVSNVSRLEGEIQLLRKEVQDLGVQMMMMEPKLDQVLESQQAILTQLKQQATAQVDDATSSQQRKEGEGKVTTVAEEGVQTTAVDI